jgi:uncharacterized 2Fe-2S/4Fe-4S cluster protein (DUF4445 family)
MIEQITIKINGIPIQAQAGLSLSEITKGEQPCGGHGLCGKCKVIAKGELSPIAEQEKALLSKDQLAKGFRLACLTDALGDCEIITLDGEKGTQIVTEGTLPAIEKHPMFENYGVAIDVGTTTLAARLYKSDGSLLASASRLNPQQEWGADVISRVESALNGKENELATSIRAALVSLITELAFMADIDPKSVDGVVITGNTIMLSLLTETTVKPFSHAPFEVKRLFGETLSALQLDLSVLNNDTKIYVAPCISAFVGADTVCALLATELCSKSTAMLADIGTNGEIALWHKGKLTVCSTAAGPAFEGVGISMGMRGATGAIDKVIILNGKLDAHVIGNVPPVGICGSGLIDAVACLLDNETLDETGYLEEESILIKEPVSITQKDIRMFQLAKSAIYAGIMTLIHSEDLTESDISALYVAGGFSNYLNKRNAARTGLLPESLARKAISVGNAALSGASMILLNNAFKTKAEAISKAANITELATDPFFAEEYVAGMLFEG